MFYYWLLCKLFLVVYNFKLTYDRHLSAFHRHYLHYLNYFSNASTCILILISIGSTALLLSPNLSYSSTYLFNISSSILILSILSINYIFSFLYYSKFFYIYFLTFNNELYFPYQNLLNSRFDYVYVYRF